MGEFDKALAACQRAARLRPEDGQLAEDFKNLSAELTMARGKYDTEVDFRESIKDRQEQEKLHAQSSVVKTDDYRVSAVEDARKKLARDPYLPMNIFNLAEALSDLENDKAENEAIELLENAYKTRDDFSYKQRAGLLRIKQLRRKIREARAALDANPDDGQARTKARRIDRTTKQHRT